MIEHLKRLGVTAVELMPVHQFVHDHLLLEKGLRNYWGYNTIGFFAPHHAYAQRRPARAAGAGVQGDGPRPARGGHRGDPRRGLQPHRRGQPPGPHAVDARASTTPRTTGWSTTTRATTWTTPAPATRCNVRNPHTLQLIMDSLRYWVTEMHVDGFRFDLASTLAREFYDVDRLSAFFDLVQQDPVVSQVKLIAEPWDVGPGGYQVGNFPPLWTEWNGKYRDTVRDFWRGEPGTLGEFASRLTGSSDLYQARRPPPVRVDQLRHRARRVHARRPRLLQREAQRGQRRGGNDGESHNRSWNCGVEGPTDDAAVLDLRAQQQRNFITTLFLSQGVPMLLHGDEMGRTQQRQQQRLLPGQRDRLAGLVAARPRTRPARVHRRGRRAARRPPGVPPAPVLRRRRSAAAARTAAPRCRTSPGSPRRRGDDRAGLGLRLRQVASRCSSTATASPSPTRRGERVTDDSFLLCLNAHHETSRSPSRRRSTARAGRSWSTRRSARC